jgi:hypothetical protein
MKKNIGTIDRIIRIVVAAIFAILYFTGIITGIWGIILVVSAGVFLLTSFVSWCPIYFSLGIRTNKTSE